MLENEFDSNLENNLTNLILPNAMFIHGISLNLNDTSTCQETQIDFSEDFMTCNDVGCENKIVPDPRHYNLGEDFIFVEQDWGSLFYKHIGKRTRLEAKNLCVAEGSSVHLPIPRFYEENEFYKTHFGDEGLWLDVSYDANEGIKSTNGHSFIRFVRTFNDKNDQVDISYRDNSMKTEEFTEIKYNDWVNLTNKHAGYYSKWGEKDVFMTNTGNWEWVDYNVEYENEEYDAVCVYNIIPEECSECQEESFCRYKDSKRKETECVCQKMTEGEYCEIDSCSHCQNGGFCKINNISPDGTNSDHDEIKCVCPYPFHGDYCEGTNIINVGSSKCQSLFIFEQPFV